MELEYDVNKKILAVSVANRDQRGIDFVSCHGDIATICGSYTDPTFCGLQYLDSIAVPGFTEFNVVIDTTNKTFCFDIDTIDFTDDCMEIYVELFFKNGTSFLPSVLSNTIEICKEDFEKKYEVDIEIGDCNNNTTDDLLSDDYYYVDVNISGTGGAGWVATRTLDNPYHGESGVSTILTGSGDQSLTFGPYLVQEGSWVLNVIIDGCEYEFNIVKGFCSGEGICIDAFKGVQVKDVRCTSGNNWQFNLLISGLGTGNYTYQKISPSPTGSVTSITNGVATTISGGAITENCLIYKLIYYEGLVSCTTQVVICPPMPCNNEEPCDLEVNIEEIECERDGSVFGFIFTASSNTHSPLCYKVVDTGGSTSTGTVSSTTYVGSRNTDTYLIIYPCNDPTCFKIIYLPKPLDCNGRESSDGRSREEKNNKSEVIVMPNPFNSKIDILSDLKTTEFELLNSTGIRIKKERFNGEKYTLDIDLASGIYYLKYLKTDGTYSLIKLVKI